MNIADISELLTEMTYDEKVLFLVNDLMEDQEPDLLAFAVEFKKIADETLKRLNEEEEEYNPSDWPENDPQPFEGDRKC